MAVALSGHRVARALDLEARAVDWAVHHSTDGRWLYVVPSQSRRGEVYLVDCTSCTCPDYTYRGTTCKHILAVNIHCTNLAGDCQPRPASDRLY